MRYKNLRENNTFMKIYIFTNLSCAQDNIDRVNHALICPWELYKFMHMPAFPYTDHSYKQNFYKVYLSFFGRLLEKICWREKYLPTKKEHRKIKLSISSKPLLKFSFHFCKHLKSRSLLIDQCQISSVVVRSENSSDNVFFFMPLSLKKSVLMALD